ncbi:hypothetical protein [Paraburkholderia nemoris]|uniref:Apea-like HEPN domain-containing protein n=1 Tax=Paraburkholderia nemoris TaxID=2793076 RepID=A0ABM8S3F3_9BURK|nr:MULTISPECIES: hypothetical protein [Paraburkholderia]KPD19640.1 hypothetical protein ADM96_04090 [Burkholderia sp. ST111]CAE6706607.1 hypothetical protein R75777_00936 [Paraburkholderia nemoris]CAE6786240.1 hypothetical protein R69776_04555 [Paraburkholderia nemoris]
MGWAFFDGGRWIVQSTPPDAFSHITYLSPSTKTFLTGSARLFYNLNMQKQQDIEHKRWALALGELILAMNEVDMLMWHIHTSIFKTPVAANWFGKTANERFKKIRAMTMAAEKSPAIDKLAELLVRIELLFDTRNHVAHGSLGLAIYANEEDVAVGETFEMMRYHKESRQMKSITYGDLVNQTKEAKQLSYEVSKLEAMFRLHPDFSKPHESQ